MATIDEMCKAVEDYIHYKKGVVVKIVIRYDFRFLDHDITLLQHAYSVAKNNENK